MAKRGSRNAGRNPGWLKTRIEKGEIDPVYFLHGPEDLERDEAVRRIVDAVLDPASRAFNLDILDGSDLDVSDAVSRASAFPMMGARRVVVVKRVEEVAEVSARAFIPLVESPSDTTVLVFTATKVDRRRKFFAALNKAAVSVAFDIPKEAQLPDWIKRRAAARGLELDPEAAHVLALSIGSKPREIVSELEKLDLHVGERRTVSREDIASLTGGARDASVFDFTEAVGARDFGTSLRLLQVLLEQGDSPVGILALLIRHLGVLRKARWLLDSGLPRSQYASKLKVPAFSVGKYTDQAARFTDGELWNAYRSLLAADDRVKSRSKTAADTLVRVVAEICRPELAAPANLDTAL